MVVAERIALTDFTRLWLIQHGAGPARPTAYEGLWKASNFSWPQGDKTPFYTPDPNRYGQFEVAGSIRGERGNPGFTVMARSRIDAQSVLLQLLRLQCPNDLQLHIGECEDPQDFELGWQRILVLTAAEPTDLTIADLGALDTSERAVMNEESPMTGEDFFEILRLGMDEQAATEIVQEIIDVTLCDRQTCGVCGIPSDGCQVWFALTLSNAGSPGLPGEVIFTDDQGATYGQTGITSLAAAEDPNAMACVGVNLVVISEDSDSLHYAPIADILAGTEVWVEVTGGFVVGNGPLNIFSTGPRHTWIVGENGYIYFSADPTAGVSVLEPGIVTTEDLNDIHGINNRELVAVGANNVVIVSRNGGLTWALTNGPAAGIVLNTVWMHSEDVWSVGAANGRLYYTEDAGVNWTEKAFPGSGAGSVRDLNFSNPTVGWMAHDLAAAAGRVLRTLNGGYSWQLAGEPGNTDIPANDRINSVMGCPDNVNIFYAGGLADDATDGILVKGVADQEI